LIILIILDEEHKLRSSSVYSFHQHPVTSALFGLNVLLSTLNLYSSFLSETSFHTHTEPKAKL
jgi:hypothetical protein